MSVGSVPPEWGSQSRGGVASLHAVLLQHISAHAADLGISVAGLVALNRPIGAEDRPPKEIAVCECPLDSKSERDWYYRLLKERSPDVVLFFHIGHRWARWHTEWPVIAESLQAVREQRWDWQLLTSAVKTRWNTARIVAQYVAVLREAAGA